MWHQWVNALLGLWIFALAFMGLVGSTLTWTLAITGLVVAILGFWGATEHNKMMHRGEGRPVW